MKLVVAAFIGALFMFFGVLLGALGSHALEEKLSQDSLNSFMIAIRYMMFHGLALLVLSAFPFIPENSKEWIALAFVVGTTLFSISILLLSTKIIHGLSVSFLGPITPIGGVLLLVGWGYLSFQLFKALWT